MRNEKRKDSKMISSPSYADEIHARIVAGMRGAYCPPTGSDPAFAVRMLERVIRLAGDGDHLEIGAFCGGSAIAAAILKGYYGLSGKVVTIDPFDPALLTSGVRGLCPDV